MTDTRSAISSAQQYCPAGENISNPAGKNSGWEKPGVLWTKFFFPVPAGAAGYCRYSGFILTNRAVKRCVFTIAILCYADTVLNSGLR
jgi:hypothetical protein